MPVVLGDTNADLIGTYSAVAPRRRPLQPAPSLEPGVGDRVRHLSFSQTSRVTKPPLPAMHPLKYRLSPIHNGRTLGGDDPRPPGAAFLEGQLATHPVIGSGARNQPYGPAPWTGAA